VAASTALGASLSRATFARGGTSCELSGYAILRKTLHRRARVAFCLSAAPRASPAPPVGSTPLCGLPPATSIGQGTYTQKFMQTTGCASPPRRIDTRTSRAISPPPRRVEASKSGRRQRRPDRAMNHKRAIPRDPPAGPRGPWHAGFWPSAPPVATASAINRSPRIPALPLGPRAAAGGTRPPPESEATKSGEEPEA
jgi:hypothetical protein